MKKSDLRKKYLDFRKTLSKDEVHFLSQKILQNFILQFNISENQNIHVFLPIEKFNEINTRYFIEFFWQRKINVFVPKIINKQLISVRYTQTTVLIENHWGIAEPESCTDENVNLDFVITPLLYCDNKGNRIGYGKGFYDRFFKKINSCTKKIGVNFFPPNELIDDINAEDVSVDYLVTPTEVLSFSLTSIFTK